MDNLETLRQERIQNKHDVFNNVIPKRVPVDINISSTCAAEYGNVDKRDALWNPTLLEKPILELAERIFTDVDLFGAGVLYPSYYQALGARNCIMSATGFMQHPNTVGMEFSDYDAFIENAYDCIIERVLPRNYKNLDLANDPGNAMLAIAKAINAQNAYMGKFAPMIKKMRELTGVPAAKPFGGGGYAPMDLLSDQLRSLSGMSTDIRRDREKVKAAVDSALILCYKSGFAPDPDNIDHDQVAFFALHMPPYMRTKDFAELWWPAWFNQVTNYAAHGMRAQAFCEENFERYYDYIDDLPTGTVLTFEYGDPKTIKDRFGKKFITTGLFPLSIVTTLSKQECIDRTKEFIDIMAPGGNFYFGFDKKPLVLSDINLENLCAITETVRDYGVYDNAGESTGLVYNKEDYTIKEIPEFKSKYYKTWDEYLKENPTTPDSARKQFEKSEQDMLKFIFRLCQ